MEETLQDFMIEEKKVSKFQCQADINWEAIRGEGLIWHKEQLYKS